MKIKNGYDQKLSAQQKLSEGEQVPDAATLYRFRKILAKNGLDKMILERVKEAVGKKGKSVRRGTMVEPMYIKAAKKQRR